VVFVAVELNATSMVRIDSTRNEKCELLIDALSSTGLVGEEEEDLSRKGEWREEETRERPCAERVQCLSRSSIVVKMGWC